uniref:Peptidase S1 domain-containing protein n=1 Tax=Anopheles arabiensis TaxID=7173 RepID=A0A1I8JT28_ANOAR
MCCSLKRVLLLFGFLYFMSRACGQEENYLTCGRRKMQSVFLIHNGVDAKAGHWPWHAAIFHGNGRQEEYQCGGSILDQNTILTASHCVYTHKSVISAARVSVHVGQIHLKETSEYTQTHGVQDIILHPEFNSNSFNNDIALLKLSTNITMTKYVQPVCLWTMDSNQEMIVGKNGTIVGFGLNEHDVVSDQLKQALVGVVDALTCIKSDRAAFGPVLTSEMFCGKGRTGVGACNGDSGGGMFFEVGGKWFVRGLVSFTSLRGNTGLCDPLKYTAYTDVAKYLEWIKQYIDHRVLSYESDVLDIDYEAKLRLFNFKTCGVKQMIVDTDGVSRSSIPWIGFVRSPNENKSRCVVTLISEWYAVGPAHCFQRDSSDAYVLLGFLVDQKSQCLRSYESTVCTHPAQERNIQKIIMHPKFGPNNSADNIALIELQRPADTSQPHVKPICLSVTPELRTKAMTNLHVATVSKENNSYKNTPVRYLEPAECMKEYTEKNITLNLGGKRLCAEIANKDKQNCQTLIAGSPLQEMRIYHGQEQYFLRGFELLGQACGAFATPIYNNIETYIDWILYNMRYSSLEVADDNSTVNTTQQTLETEWSMLQRQPGKENLHLFDMDTCGLPSTQDQSLEEFSMPWVGLFGAVQNVTDKVSSIKSLAVLISEWYALIPNRTINNDVTWRFLLLGRYNPDNNTNCYNGTCEVTHQLVEIKNVILPPANQQMFALIELLEPANLKIPYIRPICLPFMDQLHQYKPTEVIISSTRENSFAIESKKLKMIDVLNCQQNLLLEGHFVTFTENFPCAIEAENFRQIPLSSHLGSPLQSAVWYGGRKRYFLYGIDGNQPYIFKDLIHGPYMFGTIERGDLDWIVESMRENERQTSSISTTKNERIILRPVQHASKGALFNFGTCGESSSSFPMPWMGLVSSNNVTKSFAILISDRFAVGPAHYVDDVSAEYEMTLGYPNFEALWKECSTLNDFALCSLPPQKRRVQKFFVHPMYNRTTHANDIALIQLATPVVTSLPNVKPICLPFIDTVRSYYTSSLVMDVIGTSFDDIKTLDVKDRYINPLECRERWEGLKVKFTIDSMKHCVIPKRMEEDQLFDVQPGFSLHSLQTHESSEKHFLRGFVIINPGASGTYYPVVYTNTDANLDWILETMEQPASLPFDLRKELTFSDK